MAANCSSSVSRRTLSSCTENFTFSSRSRASCTAASVPMRRSSSCRRLRPRLPSRGARRPALPRRRPSPGAPIRAPAGARPRPPLPPRVPPRGPCDARKTAPSGRRGARCPPPATRGSRGAIRRGWRPRVRRCDAPRRSHALREPLAQALPVRLELLAPLLESGHGLDGLFQPAARRAIAGVGNLERAFEFGEFGGQLLHARVALLRACAQAVELRAQRHVGGCRSAPARTAPTRADPRCRARRRVAPRAAGRARDGGTAAARAPNAAA